MDFFTPGGKLVTIVLIKANDKFPDIELLENKDKIMYQCVCYFDHFDK